MKKPDKKDLLASTTITQETGQKGSVFSKVFVELEVELLDASNPIFSKFYQYPFGDLTFLRAITKGGHHRVKRTKTLIHSSEKNNFYVGFIISGEATLVQEEHTAKLLTSDIAILDSTREYIIEVPHGFDALWVNVPRYRLEGRMNLPGDILAQRIDGKTGAGHVASHMLYAALEEAQNIDNPSASRIANHILDLITLTLKASCSENRNNRKQSNYQRSILRRIQNYVEANLDEEELSPDKIANDNGISVRYLNKLFSREGTSTAKWIRMRRLERCRDDLEEADKLSQSINEIAFAHGFSNISSFNRAFKQHFETSPSALRQNLTHLVK